MEETNEGGQFAFARVPATTPRHSNARNEIAGTASRFVTVVADGWMRTQEGSSWRREEDREKEEGSGRKDGGAERYIGEVSADFRLGNGTDEEPSILMNRA